MEFLQLVYFKAVAEKGKIVSAAESLYITPPALSASISRLERELNIKLFERTNNSIRLNRQGEILLRYTNQILSSLDNAKLELELSMHESEPHIHVVMTNANIWVDLLSAFSQEYPHITLSNTTIKLSQIPLCSLSPRYNFLLAEEYDLESGRFEMLSLITNDEPLLMVHPSHPLVGHTSIDLREIRDETFLLPVAGTSMHRLAQYLLDQAGIPTRNVYEYSYMVRRKMVVNGQGVSFSTTYTSRGEDSSLCYIPIKYPFCRQTHRLFWDKGRILTSEEEAFQQFAEEYFGMEADG